MIRGSQVVVQHFSVDISLDTFRFVLDSPANIAVFTDQEENNWVLSPAIGELSCVRLLVREFTVHIRYQLAMDNHKSQLQFVLSRRAGCSFRRVRTYR